MGRSPSRPVDFSKPGTDASGGPGTYDIPKPEVKSFTIAGKRQEKVEADNRNYSPERAEALTKAKVP